MSMHSTSHMFSCSGQVNDRQTTNNQVKLCIFPKPQLFYSWQLTDNIVHEQSQVKVHKFYRVHVKKIPSIHFLFLANVVNENKGHYLGCMSIYKFTSGGNCSSWLLRFDGGTSHIRFSRVVNLAFLQPDFEILPYFNAPGFGIFSVEKAWLWQNIV